MIADSFVLQRHSFNPSVDELNSDTEEDDSSLEAALMQSSRCDDTVATTIVDVIE